MLNRCSEALQRISRWLYEILYGVTSARDLLDIAKPFPVQLVTDALDVYSTLQCSRPYAGADESLSAYLECLREDLLQGRLEEFLWVPTDSMLADGGSKVMQDLLAAKLLSTGIWKPREHKVLLRENMDGADTIDRQRRRQRAVYEDEEEDWYESQAPNPDAWTAWYAGCSEVGKVGCGCEGTCPVCINTVYECEEDRLPLTYWLAESLSPRTELQTSEDRAARLGPLFDFL